ncbi:MAG: LysR family transcriptional regulator [Planctomycetaceae bacterium]
MPWTMSLPPIELFCEVVAHRSFSKAAESLGLSQPAVSQTMLQLEQRLGVQLIDRSTRPFGLTAAGRYYHEQMRRLLDSLHAAEDEVRGMGGKVCGRVRVVSIYSVGLLQMREYISRYRATYPEVELHLDYAHPDELYERIVRDEADLGIVSFPRDRGDIGCVEWVSEEMVVVCPVDHVLANRATVSLSELAGQDFVAFTDDLTIRRETDKLLRKQKVSVSIVQQFDNIENIKRAVEIGLGISLLPLPTVRRELEFGTIRAVPLNGVRFERPLGIVHKRHKHLSTAASRFIELLHDGVIEGSSQSPGPAVVTSALASTANGSSSAAPASASPGIAASTKEWEPAVAQ